MEYVTVYTDQGGVGLGKIDDKGRLVWRSGAWINVPREQADLRDKILRRGVRKIVKDNGKEYKRRLLGLRLPLPYEEAARRL